MLKPAHAKALMQEAAGRKGDIPTKAEILKRSDEKPPTLIPSENSMVLGERVFAMGNSRDQGTSKNSPRSSSVAPTKSKSFSTLLCLLGNIFVVEDYLSA